MSERVRQMGACNPYVADIVALLGLSPLEAACLTSGFRLEERDGRAAEEDHRRGVRYRTSYRAGELTTIERRAVLEAWRASRSEVLHGLAERIEPLWALDDAGHTGRKAQERASVEFRRACSAFNRRIIEPIERFDAEQSERRRPDDAAPRQSLAF